MLLLSSTNAICHSTVSDYVKYNRKKIVPYNCKTVDHATIIFSTILEAPIIMTSSNAGAINQDPHTSPMNPQTPKEHTLKQTLLV